MTASVLCTGNATLDRIWQVAALPKPGQKMRALSTFETGGGQAANAAVAISRLGGRTALCGAVGDDAAGTMILAGLRREGVAVSGVQIVAGARSLNAMVLVDAVGERIVVGDVDPALYGRAAPVRAEMIAGHDAVLADVKYADGAEVVLRAARASNIPTVLDVEPAAAGHHERLCPLADHAIFGQAGLADYTGTNDPVAGLTSAFQRLGCVVGVTLGAGGVRLQWRDGAIHIPAFPIAAVDTTGAGDAFHGAYALMISEGRDCVAAARFASAVAVLKCLKPGSRGGLPTRPEAEAFIAQASMQPS
jgi:sulfofructose kinase